MLSELSKIVDMTCDGDSLREKAFRLANDVYVLKDGAYFKIDKTGKVLNHIIVNKNTIENEDYRWFKQRDFYSKLVTMNKPVDKTKKIHSNNMYTIFVKCENLPEFMNDKISFADFDTNIEIYFSKLLDKPEKAEKEIYKLNNIVLIDENEANKLKKTLQIATREIVDIIKDFDKASGFSQKSYVKIFVQTEIDETKDLENYKREGERYLANKVFNDNQYNISIDSKLYGLSGENMGLNSKKPYYEMKSTKYKIPYRVVLEEAIVNYYLMQWIENSKELVKNKKDNTEKEIKRTGFNIPYNVENDIIDLSNSFEKGFSFETMPTKSGDVIKDINYIPKNIEQLEKIFKLEDYVGLNSNKSNTIVFNNGNSSSTKKRYELEEYIDKVFFKNQIKILYYNEEYTPKGLSTSSINAMMMMKYPMKSYFRLGDEKALNSIIDKISHRLVCNLFLNDDTSTYAIKEALNLRLNLLRYFNIGGKENMGNRILELKEEIKEKLGSYESVIDNDEQYYYCVGQIVYYLISKSKAKNKNHSLYNSIINAKNDKILKDNIKKLYLRYNYAIQDIRGENNVSRFNKLYEMICGYTLENEKFFDKKDDILMGSIFSNNVIYNKKSDNENKEEE